MPYVFDTDFDEQFANKGVLEIPISGPGRANCLVVLSGIINSGHDVESSVPTSDNIDVSLSDGETVYPVGYIFLNYVLGPNDEYKKIVDDTDDAKHASFIALAGIAADDDTDVLFGVSRVDTRVNDGGRVYVKFGLGLSGDVVISRLSYHVSLLIRKPVPAATPGSSALRGLGPLRDPLRPDRISG
jgi:hypothetical protein